MADINYKAKVDVTEFRKLDEALRREALKRMSEVDRTEQELIRRRSQLETTIIEDAHERKKAQIDQRYDLEMQRMARLIEMRREEGLISRSQAEEELRDTARLIDSAKMQEMERLQRAVEAGNTSINQGANQASMSVANLSRLLTAGAAASVNFQGGMRGLFSQMISVSYVLQRLRGQLAGQQSMMSAIARQLFSPTGMIAAVAAIGSVAMIAGPRIMEMLRGTREEAAVARDELSGIVDSILQINRTPIRLSFNEEEIGFAIDATRQLVQDQREVIKDLNDANRERQRAGLRPGEGESEQVREARRARIQEEEVLLGIYEEQESRLVAQQRTMDLTERAREAAIEAGARLNALERETTRDLMTERERSLDDERTRYEQRLYEAGSNAEARLKVEEAHRHNVEEINARFDEQDKRRSEQTARRREEIDRMLFQVRLELMGRATDREIAEINRVEEERLQLVGNSEEAVTQIRNSAALQRLAVATQEQQRVTRLRREAEAFEADLADRRYLREAATDEEREQREIEVMQRRSERLRAQEEEDRQAIEREREQREALGVTESDIIDAMVDDLERLTRTRILSEEEWMDAIEGRRRAQERDQEAHEERIGQIQAERRELQLTLESESRRDRIIRLREREAALLQIIVRSKKEEIELEELQNEILRERIALQSEIEQVTRRVLDAAFDAFSYERQLSDAYIDETYRRMEEEELALQESYANREITAREFNNRMALLAEDRSAFEKEVAQDTANATTRIALSTVGVLKEVALDAIKTYLARAAAAQIEKVMSGPIPFPANVALVGGAVASIFALEGVIRSMAGFKYGGVVQGPGTGTSDSIPAWLSRGEFVFTERAARGNERFLYSLMNQMETGEPISSYDYMHTWPGWSEPVGSSVDNTLLLSEMRENNRLLRENTRKTEEVTSRAALSMSNTVSRATGDPDSTRRILLEGQVAERSLSPRTGRL